MPPSTTRTTTCTTRASVRLLDLLRSSRTARGEEGQTTAEYGLVILAAGTLALAAILWARSSGSIAGLFQTVMDQLTGSLGD